MAGSDIIGGFKVGFSAMQTMVEATRTAVTERRHRDEAKKYNIELTEARESLRRQRLEEEARMEELVQAMPMESREDELRKQVFAFQKAGELSNKYADLEQEMIHSLGAKYPGNAHVEKAWGLATDGAFKNHKAEQGQILNASKAWLGQMGDELDHLQGLEHAAAQRGEHAPGTPQWEQQQIEKRETVRAKTLQAVMNAHAKAAGGGDDLLQMVQLGQAMGPDGKIDPAALEALEAKLGSTTPLDFATIATEAEALTAYILDGVIPEGSSPEALNVRYELDTMGLLPEGSSVQHADQSGPSMAPSASTAPSAAGALAGADTGMAPGESAGAAVRQIPSKIRSGVHAVEDEFSAGMAEKGTQVKGFLRGFMGR